MKQRQKEEPMAMFGDCEQIRAFSHISDVASIIASSVYVPSARNQIFNVGADVPHSVNDLAKVVAAAMGKGCKVVHLDPRNEVKIAFSDHSRAENVFGARQKASLEDGMRNMAALLKDHGCV